jgi:AcrR family transcriptional regulator
MGKGEATKSRILDRALTIASLGGIENISVGALAGEMGMSKSGLFGHFRSKEQLQLEILERAIERFVEVVVSPALKQPRGVARVRALYENWMRWDRDVLPGGCVFNAVGSELETLPESVQARYLESQRDWFESIATIARGGISAGQLRADLDPHLFAFELIGITKSHNFMVHMMRDPRAEELSRRAVDELIARSATDPS